MLTLIAAATIASPVLAQPATTQATTRATTVVAAPTRQAIEAELAAVIDEMLAADPHAGDQGSTQPADDATTPRERLLTHGEALLDQPTNPMLPVDWSTLDDAGATKLVDQLDQIFRDFKLDVAPVVRWLEAKQQHEPLTGPRVHLLARLMYGELDALTKSVKPPTTRK